MELYQRDCGTRESMIIALGIPAYRQQIHVRAGYTWVQDALTAVEYGWKPAPFFVDNSGIARARNNMIKMANELDARLLLTMDADSFPMVPDGGLAHMWAVMQEHDAAVVLAAFVVRNGKRLNVEPVKLGETYEGEGGTAYMLIDLWKLRDLPKPWFVHEDTDDGLGVSCGEDVYFCRHAKAHGHKIVVTCAIPTGHATGELSTLGC
jgi:hypothetical protein